MSRTSSSTECLQEPPQLRVVHDPPAHPYEFVDVLVRYSQFHQHLGQFVGVRKHAVTPSFGPLVNVRSEEYVAREEW